MLLLLMASLILLTVLLALPPLASQAQQSVARQWDEEILAAIRIDLPRPPATVMSGNHEQNGAGMMSPVDGAAAVGIDAVHPARRVDLPGLSVLCVDTIRPGAHGGRVTDEVGAAAIELARAAPNPVMVLGDLNATSWTPYFAELILAGGLSDSRRGFGVASTWPGFMPLPLRIPIDHCLVSREIGVRERRVGQPVGSDHRPIVVDFWMDPR